MQPPPPPGTPFEIRIDDLSSDAVKELLVLHLRGMAASSPPGGVHALDLSRLLAPAVTVWTAWSGERIAAIGALQMLDGGVGEVKSMRTHPDFLRQGAASQILQTIIAAAAARGVVRLSLETGSGPAFEPAAAFYRRRGFVDGPAFADYRDDGFSRFLHLAPL